jgi:TolB protein
MLSRITAVLASTLLSVLMLVSPAQATFPGKNGKIAFDRVDPAHHRSVITTMNADGSGVTSLGLEGTQPTWSADGSKIAFSAGSSGQGQGISIANSDGTGLIRLTERAMDDRHPTWSPDGKWIAFARYDPGIYYQLYIIGADGTGLRMVRPSGLDWALDPEWSADGSRIVLFGQRTSDPYYLNNIYTVRPDGTGLVQVTSGPYDDEDPTWSPDGSQIAFVANREGYQTPWRIYSTAADGSGAIRRLSGGAASEIQPSWSPDGSKIVFDIFPSPSAPPEPPGYNIYMMDPNGSARTKLTASGGDEDPDWQPIPGPKRSDYKNAAQFCKAEQAFWGDQFAERYGDGPSPYGKCVSQNH